MHDRQDDRQRILDEYMIDTTTHDAFQPVWLVADCMVTALEVKPYGTGQTLVQYSRVSDPDSIRSVDPDPRGQK